MQPNKTKAKLKAGEPVIGLIVQGYLPDVVEIAGLVGFDFVFLDGEHGQIGPSELIQLVRTAEAVGITPIARVPHNEADVILRFLETGAQGIVVPQVNSRASAEYAVRAAKYYPEGMRGLAGGRAAGYGLTQPLTEYIQIANREILLVALVEDKEAVENLPEILSVDGIDVINIGPSDLSQSLGYPGQLNAPPVQQAIETIVRSVVGTDKAVGMNAPDGDVARRYIEMGARFIVTSFPGLLARAARDYLTRARGAVPAAR